MTLNFYINVIFDKHHKSLSLSLYLQNSAMSSSTVDSAEAQWIQQLATMRAALAELNLPSMNRDIKSIDDDDDDDFTSGNSGDDVWDFISDSEEELYSSDILDDPTPNEAFGQIKSADYGPAWLKSRCIGFAGKREGLSAEDLQEQIMALLASDSVEDELQSTLTDIVGFDDFEFIIELISHRKEISARPVYAGVGQTDGLFGRIQTKRQREEALRKRDYEHKHATLGPSLNRDGPQYPHVYQTHSAGNKLSVSGKSYGLPIGSQRTEHDVSFF